MRLIERLKRILLRVRAKPEWPPRREYEWRTGVSPPWGRSTSLNACLFYCEAFAGGHAKVRESDSKQPESWLAVVATGERVRVVLTEDGAIQLADAPDLPRYRR